MHFRSSTKVFKPNKRKFIFIHDFLSGNFDFVRMGVLLHRDFYALTKCKNTPYNPSSMIRLILMLEIFAETYKYSSHNSKLIMDDDLIGFCGFLNGNTPSYSTFYYFKKRIKDNSIILILNKVRARMVTFFLKYAFSRTKKVILAIDSKPIATDGNHPRGTIRSHNKFLDKKLGIKIHTLNIVYPFLFPISFAFTPAHHSDNPLLKEFFPDISPIIEYTKAKNIPLFLTADKGYQGYGNIELCTVSNVIPIIVQTKNFKTMTLEKFFKDGEKVFCRHGKLSLRHNGFEKKQNRHNYKCTNKDCIVEKCSRRLWVSDGHNELSKPNGDYFLIRNSYLNLASSELFPEIYKHRGKTELLHSIWHHSYSLRNVFYLRDYFELVRFERNLMKNITYDALFKLESSPLTQYCS